VNKGQNHMDKLTPNDGASPDIVAGNIEKLREIFPEVFADGSVDFDALKQTLGSYADDREERYSFTWHGKSRARRIAQMPSSGTLLPCKEESVNWDSTQNIFIEGDNLEVLKILQKSYHRKVKMIYIDPPYNTGNEFIYPDKYQDNLDTYLKYTGQVDDEGFKLSANTETSGRYHTNWLNMMYPRLKLARNLLRDDGVIFVSIDDNEIHNLRTIMDEIYGPENFIGIVVINSSPSAIDYGHLGKVHDYALFYAKNGAETVTYQIPEKDKRFKYSDETGPFNIYPLYNGNVAFNPKTRPNLYYPFHLNPEGKLSDEFYEISLEQKDGWVEVFPVISRKDGIQRVWRWGKPKAQGELNREIVGYKTEGGEYRVVQKTRLTGKMIRSIQADTDVSSRKGTGDLERLFGRKVFSFPKPVELIRRLVQVGSSENDIVLDFFAGSGPTAEAVFKEISEGNGNRRFILIQLPEPCAPESEAAKLGLTTIADICKQRIRAAGSGTESLNESQLPGMAQRATDLGFKAFKLSSSNIKPWDTDFEELDGALLGAIDNIKSERSEQDVLYELLLKYGLDLAIPVDERNIADKTVFIIGAGALVVCLDSGVTLDVVRGIAELKTELNPEVMRVVFKDSGFENDVVKTNTVQILKQAGVDDVKSL